MSLDYTFFNHHYEHSFWYAEVRGNMLCKNKPISMTRNKFNSFRTTLCCFWKLLLTLKSSQWVEEGKCAHSHEGQEELLESYRLVSLSLVPRKVTKDSHNDHKFSWKTFLDMSKIRRWLAATSKDSARANYASLIWLNFAIRLLGQWMRGAMDVICLDLSRAFDMVSHCCSILLVKWKIDWLGKLQKVLPQGVWQLTGCFLVALLRALCCRQCYLTSSLTARKMGWATTRTTVTDDT